MLRPIGEVDVCNRYLGWFSDPEVIRYIEAARVPQTIDTLREFVRTRVGRDDVWFLGIFSRQDGEMIGTIKCEPIDLVGRIAVMGILIGEPSWRGVGLAGEVISAVSSALHDRLGIQSLELGVDPANVRALRAYDRLGFRVRSRSSAAIRMVRNAIGGGDAPA